MPDDTPEDVDTTPDEEEDYDNTANVEELATLLKDDGFVKSYLFTGKPYVCHPGSGVSVFPMRCVTRIHYPAKFAVRALATAELTQATPLHIVADIAATLTQRGEIRHRARR